MYPSASAFPGWRILQKDARVLQCGGLSYMPSPGIKWMSQSADGDFGKIRRNYITENVSSNFGPYPEIRLLDKSLLRQIYFHLFSSLSFCTFCTKHWSFSATFTTSASGTSCTICVVREILLWEPLKGLIILELFSKGKTFKYHKSCLCSLERKA